MELMAAMELDRRKEQVLAAAVRHYVTTAHPAGSQVIAERLGGGVSSATIRNEMSALEEAGYLHQPHTSAGRVPTDQGYRLYVTRLMRKPSLTSRERARFYRWLREQTEVEPALDSSCRLLAEVTHYPSLASAPRWSESCLARLDLVRVGSRHVLVIVISTSGEVRHTTIALRRAPTERLLRRLAALINQSLAGRTVGEIDRQSLTETLARTGAGDLLEQVIDVVQQESSEGDAPRVFLQGARRIFEQREFADVDRVRNLWGLLEDSATIERALPVAEPGEVAIAIGSENRHPALSDCSLVSSSYWLGERRAGSVGILGPKRMNYERSVAAVGWMAQSLGRALARLAQS
jgi:heat-inducible transcriptional repressor